MVNKALITSLFVATSLLCLKASANNYQMIRDCISDGDSYIKVVKDLGKDNPRLIDLLINDSEVAAIREAEAECAKKTPEEKAALKQKWDSEFSAKHGVKTPQQPPAYTGNHNPHSMPDAFSPGGIFNPIHVKVH